MPCVVKVWVAHGWVFTHDVHAADLVRIAVICQSFAHDFYHCVARCVVEWCIPKFLKPCVGSMVVDSLVIGKHHGNQTRIARTLDIVLSTQGMQTRTGLTDLPSHRDQCNKASRIVCSMHVLANAHAPQNHGAPSGCKFTRDFAQGGSRNSANRRHGFWAIAFDVFFQGVKVIGAVANEVLVDQALFNDGVNQGVEHRHIGIGFELQGAPCVFSYIGDARIRQHNLGAFLGSVLHPGCGDGVVVGGVGANHQNQACVFNIIDLVAHCARAHTFQ